tara:strand:- start:3202 stop:3720 length:519 start_codon:yes stop_codon:yes gene_type:complete
MNKPFPTETDLRNHELQLMGFVAVTLSGLLGFLALVEYSVTGGYESIYYLLNALTSAFIIREWIGPLPYIRRRAILDILTGQEGSKHFQIKEAMKRFQHGRISEGLLRELINTHYLKHQLLVASDKLHQAKLSLTPKDEARLQELEERFNQCYYDILTWNDVDTDMEEPLEP